MSRFSAPVSLLNRRSFLRMSVGGLLCAPGLSALASTAERRSLAFVHTHTAESLAVTYFANGAYVDTGLGRLNHLLRDFRTNDQFPMDRGLFDILYDLQVLADRDATFEIISAYRSPQTNQMLHNRSSGVASRSLHMDGKAIDVRLTGFPTKQLRDLALSMQRGGVGYYAESNFLHVDTGRVRRW